METVFGFFKDFVRVFFENFFGNFLTAVRRQAVLDHNRTLGEFEQFVVDLIAWNSFMRSSFSASMPIDARVGNDDIRVLDGFFWIFSQRNLPGNSFANSRTAGSG